MTGALTVRNCVRRHRVDRRLLRRIVQRLLREFPDGTGLDLGIYVVGEAAMIRLNETFVRHRGSTDVITFDYSVGSEVKSRAGEIFVCLDEACLQARKFGTTWQCELVRYIVHGLLHLNGYDDRRRRDRNRMKRRENQLVRALTSEFDVEKLGLSTLRYKTNKAAK